MEYFINLIVTITMFPGSTDPRAKINRTSLQDPLVRSFSEDCRLTRVDLTLDNVARKAIIEVINFITLFRY
jgi:hypothetical protein